MALYRILSLDGGGIRGVHNLPNREADKEQLIRDVALYTCSAPDENSGSKLTKTKIFLKSFVRTTIIITAKTGGGRLASDLA